jgi:uncharacterized integral membrane protein
MVPLDPDVVGRIAHPATDVVRLPSTVVTEPTQRSAPMAKDDRRWIGEGGEQQGDGGDGLSAKQVVAGIVGIVLVVFVLQNTDSTSITLLIFDVTFPLWLVLVVTIALSVGIGYLVGSRRRKG